MGKVVLVTGFAPFGGETINPSFEAVRHLPDVIGDVRIVKKELPVTYDGAPKALRKFVDDLTASDMLLSVICFGQAGRSDSVRIEQRAVNEMNAKSPDNDGVTHSGDKIALQEPEEYGTTLPTDEIISALTKAQIPASQSHDAGKYVCNTIFYTLMGIAAEQKIACAGFVHVPYAESQVQGKPEGTPFMTQDMINRAVQVVVTTTVKNANRKQKMTKDIVPENFTLPLVVTDAVPVVLFGVNMIVFGSIVHNLLFVIGACICLAAGISKVVWKLIVVLKKKNVWGLFLSMRYVMPVGFAFFLAGMLIDGVSNGSPYIGQAMVARPNAIFFMIGFLGLLLMAAFACVLDSSKVRNNWIEEITNGLSQLSFLVGLLLMMRML